MKVNFSMILKERRKYNAYNRGRRIECAFTIPYIFRRDIMPPTKLERDFQAKLIKELQEQYPDAIIYKNESKQGLPDLTILEGDRWALLECKRTENSNHRPNQDYYVEKANKMSFSRFINPENKEEVLYELQQAFGARK